MSGGPRHPDPSGSYELAWHRAECGGYTVDLAIWGEIAGSEPKRILDLGCGSGRVAAFLSAAGHQVTGLDSDGILLSPLTEQHPQIAVVQADARDFELGNCFDLVVAPMQLLQLFLSREDRAACLRCARRHLVPGGLAAIALVDLEPGTLPHGENLISGQVLVPDRFVIDAESVALSRPVRFEIDGDDVLNIDRIRQIVTPSDRDDGTQRVVAEETIRHSLKLFSPAEFELELEAAGFKARAWRHLPSTDAHMGSLIALAEKPQ